LNFLLAMIPTANKEIMKPIPGNGKPPSSAVQSAVTTYAL